MRNSGKKAEQAACLFLEKAGLCLLKQNYHCYHGEIDLIMQDKQDIVFVEVRSRGQSGYGNALESINRNKMIKLMRSATHYLQSMNCLDKITSRFDIIAIDVINNEPQMKWIKNAFEFRNN